jgi:hypothetical protein
MMNPYNPVNPVEKDLRGEISAPLRLCVKKRTRPTAEFRLNYKISLCHHSKCHSIAVVTADWLL